ncbi:MAG: serine/threonine-protein kinase [Verrucomicrobiota bacterium]
MNPTDNEQSDEMLPPDDGGQDFRRSQSNSKSEQRLAGEAKGVEANWPPVPANLMPGMGEDLAGFFAFLKTEDSGEQIGPYKLIQRLGEGGFGTVWMATQQEPVRRRVALKILKLGMDTWEVVARFEQERQALAMMDHANIAKVFDAGATKWGRPFFVMELVRGVPMTDFCDSSRLGMRERLELFVDVCRAVQHAHQKGIIHRDLKPSNILVAVHDSVPRPKIIDFGLAKATQGRLTDKTLFTEVQQIMGTPLYMSPEQAAMTSLDIDTRSDIYSLGVILYELVTAQTPLDVVALSRAGFDEIRRVIREVDPPRPSARVQAFDKATLVTAAKQRQVAPSKFSAMICGDLDWIIMKCLEKDRERRYDTANSLALDVERYLANETVTARPPTVAYQLGKFIRRHKLAVGAAFAVASALLIGAVVSTWQAIAKEKALRQAWAAESDTKAFGDFLVRRVLSATRPQEVEGGPGVDVTVAAALQEAVKTLKEDFYGRPRAEARARHAIGVTWETLGRYPEAIEQLMRAIELRESPGLLGPDDPATLEAINDLAVVYAKAGHLEKALPLYQMVFEKRRARLGADHPHVLTSLNNLAGAYEMAGDLRNAVQLYEKNLASCRTILGWDDPYTLKATGNLARVWMALHDFDKALPLYELACARSQATLGSAHPDTLTCMNNLAVAYEKTGKSGKSTALYEEVVQVSTARLGVDHPDTLTSMNNLAGAYEQAGALSKALAIYQTTLEKGRIKPGADHRETLTTMINLAVAYEKAGELQKALPLYEEALERRQRTLDPDHADTLKLMSNLAVAYSEAGEHEKAMRLFQQVAERRRIKLGADNADALKSLRNLALSHWMLKDFEKSLLLLEEHLTRQKARSGHGDPQIAALEQELANRRTEAQRLKVHPPEASQRR